MRVFYAASAKYWPIIDAFHEPTQRGLYGKKTLAELQAEYPDGVLMDEDEANAAANARYVTQPTEVDEARFMYLLEVLPPARWERRNDCESFRMSEFTAGNVTLAVVRRGDRFFTWDDYITTKHDALMAKLDAWLAARPPAPRCDEAAHIRAEG